MTPVLILVFHINAATAIATGVVWMGLTKLIGARSHLRLGTVNRQLVRFLCLGGIPGVMVGCSCDALLLRWLPRQADAILMRCLAVVLIVVAVLMYYQAMFKKRSDPQRPQGEWMGPRRKPFTIGIGFLGGVTMALTSGGAGALVMVLIVLLYPLEAASIVGSDIVYGAVIAILAGLLHGAFDYIHWSLLPNLLAGSLPAIYVGSSLCARLPERVLRPVMATVFFITGMKMV